MSPSVLLQLKHRLLIPSEFLTIDHRGSVVEEGGGPKEKRNQLKNIFRGTLIGL